VSADARPQGSAARGRLRIYLGYAPGAGTTCALLSEGRRRAEHGTDVVVASADAHGRPHTECLLAGLEVIPSAKVPHRGTLAQEMDLGAVLARGPAVALVEDFAHRNTPGSRHRARWQDVEDLLAAGIYVTSTVSVGHLDSLADMVAKITDETPRQTVPDPIVRAAGEVELVDLAPEALQDRLARSHIYPADQAEAALGGWFQTGNLSTLRELALLWLAAVLTGGPRRHLPGGGDPCRGQARKRVVAALSGGPEGETLIRPGGPDRRPVRRGPAGRARRPAWPAGPRRPCRARRPAPAGRVAPGHLPCAWTKASGAAGMSSSASWWGGVRGQADRCCPAGLRRLWRYDEDAMTNIRTPIGSLGAGRQRSRLAWLCALPTPGKRQRGVSAVVTESPCRSQSSASVSFRPTPGHGLVGNLKSCCSHEEVRQWEARISPTPTLI
jgi:Osmosensitive K+ channel His kinase sensor domain